MVSSATYRRESIGWINVTLAYPAKFDLASQEQKTLDSAYIHQLMSVLPAEE